MFNRGNKGRSPVSAPTVVGAETRFKGDIVSSGAVHVDGEVLGDISCQTLMIGPAGSAIGKVEAQNSEIFGTLRGTLRSRAVFLAKTAKVLGDIFHDTMEVEAGAQVEGRWARLETSPAVENAALPAPEIVQPVEQLRRGRRPNGHAQEDLDAEAHAQAS